MHLCCEGGWVWAPDQVWGDGSWGGRRRPLGADSRSGAGMTEEWGAGMTEMGAAVAGDEGAGVVEGLWGCLG